MGSRTIIYCRRVGNEIVYVELNKSNKKINVSNDGKEIKLKDGDGSDTNARFSIVSGNARFSPDGKKIIGSGKCTIRLRYDDKVNVAGESVRKIIINGVVWNKERKTKGKDEKTVELRPVSQVVTGADALPCASSSIVINLRGNNCWIS